VNLESLRELLDAAQAAEGSGLLRERHPNLRELVVNSPPRPSLGLGGTWRLIDADGTRGKLRWLPSTARAERLAALAEVCEGLPLARVVARRGQFLLEEWIFGDTLAETALCAERAAQLGELAGRLASSTPEEHGHNSFPRSDESLLDKGWRGLETAWTAGCLTTAEVDQLGRRMEANRPRNLDVGLVHLDLKPENVVSTGQGLRLIDNELLEVGPLDQDLARLWCLWPMSATQRNHFQRAYERVRPMQDFLLHEVFWAIQTLATTLAWQLRLGNAPEGLVVGLKRLADGELPRNWVTPPTGVDPAGADVNPAANRAARRVRLAFLCDYLAIGGQERICLELIRGLDRRRFEPFLYAFRGGALESEFRQLGIPLLIGSPRDPLVAESKWTVEDVREKLAYRGLLAATLRRDAIDAALVFAWRDALPALQQAGVRVAIEKLDGPSLIGKLVDKSGFDRVVAESQTVRNDLLNRVTEFGLTADQVEFIYPGIDLASFDPQSVDRDARRAELGIGPDDFVVGTVGRLIPDKNVKLLVKAFATLAASAVERGAARLLICGPDGGALPELRELVTALGLESRTLFLPPTTKVAQVLATLDVFVMTSLREGLPTALLEAMAMGLPIVTTGIGSIPEVLRGNGFLLPGYAAEGIGQRLARLWEDSELRRVQGAHSRSIATRFASRHSVGRYQELVLECLAEKPATAPPWPAGADWSADGTGTPEDEQPAAHGLAASPTLPRVLALLDGLEDSQRDLLPALAGQTELTLVWLRRPAQRHSDPPPLGKLKYRAKVDFDTSPRFEVLCAAQIGRYRPDIVYLAPTRDEGLVARLRLLLDALPAERRPRLVRSLRAFQCREWSLHSCTDQTQTLVRTSPHAHLADGWVLESAPLRDRAQHVLGLDPSLMLVVPTSQSLAQVVPPQPRLSQADQQLHLGLPGHLSGSKHTSGWWLDLVRELGQAGFVVHSFFTGDELAARQCHELAQECPQYHCESPLDLRDGEGTARRLSRLDLVGIFAGAAPGGGHPREDLGVPVQGVQAWLLGGVPVVCDSRQRGLAEWISHLGWGFVVDEAVDAAGLIHRRDEIATATRACLERRTLLSAESQAVRMARFLRRVLSQRTPRGSVEVIQP